MTESVVPKLAVVPFDFCEENKGHLDVIGEILANNVIRLLSRSLLLKVISRLSTTKFRGTDWSFADIRSKLDCDFVLFGSYSENNGELNLFFRLVNTSNEVDVWSDDVRCSIQDILATDSALLESIASSTSKKILDSFVSVPEPDSLDSLETHALYIKGLSYMHSASLDEFTLSRDCFMQIAERQPMHSTVNALIALWHLLQTQRNGGWALRDQRHTAALMRQYIEKSLELNPGNEYTLALKGWIEVFLDKTVDLGLDLVEQALASNKNDPAIFCSSSLVYTAASQFDIAVTCIDRAIELSPLDPQLEYFYALAAGAHYGMGQYVIAEQYARRSIEINPNHTSPRRTIIAIQMANQESELAKISARELMSIEPGFTVDSWLTHWSGNPDDGKQFAARLAAAGIPLR